MANWYYYNKNGEKIGPIKVAALKTLAMQGLITPETVIENINGRSSVAGKVNGLTFPEPVTTSEPAIPSPSSGGGEVYGLSTPQQTSAPPVVPEPDPFPPLVSSDPFAAMSMENDPFNISTSFPIEQSPFTQPAPMAVPTPGSFCSSCGTPIAPTVRFCSGCGSPTAGSTGAAPSTQSSSQSGGHPLGNVLASSKGKGSSAVSGVWVAGFIAGGMLAAALISIASSLYDYGKVCEKSSEVASMQGNTERAYNEADEADLYMGLGNTLFMVGLIIPIFPIFLGAIAGGNIARSEITVYENGITGMAGLLKSSAFQFTYDKIVSAKAAKSIVTINASGSSYLCYAANELAATEIQRVIIGQQNKHKNSFF